MQWVFARLYRKSYNKALKPIDFRTHLKNSSSAMVLSSTPVVDKYGAALREIRLAIQAYIAPSYPYIAYLLLGFLFQL